MYNTCKYNGKTKPEIDAPVEQLGAEIHCDDGPRKVSRS